jgi:hypothetical protein
LRSGPKRNSGFGFPLQGYPVVHESLQDENADGGKLLRVKDISWLALDLANIPYIVEPIKFATVKPATIYILKNH